MPLTVPNTLITPCVAEVLTIECHHNLLLDPQYAYMNTHMNGTHTHTHTHTHKTLRSEFQKRQAETVL